MGVAKVTIEFTGRIEIETQGWSNDCKLDQIKKQAQGAVNHWTLMVKKGSQEPTPINYIKMKVTEVTLPIDEE